MTYQATPPQEFFWSVRLILKSFLYRSSGPCILSVAKILGERENFPCFPPEEVQHMTSLVSDLLWFPSV